MLKQTPDIWESVSATTRAPRTGEIEGTSYFFMSKESFETLIEQNGFIEYANVHGNYYGTPLAPVKEHVASGQKVILEIDVQGALQVKEKFPELRLVFIAPPSLEELESRIRGRGTEDDEQIATRMKTARKELDMAKEYDVVIVNEDIDQSVQELIEVIQAGQALVWTVGSWMVGLFGAAWGFWLELLWLGAWLGLGYLDLNI